MAPSSSSAAAAAGHHHNQSVEATTDAAAHTAHGSSLSLPRPTTTTTTTTTTDTTHHHQPTAFSSKVVGFFRRLSKLGRPATTTTTSGSSTPSAAAASAVPSSSSLSSSSSGADRGGSAVPPSTSSSAASSTVGPGSDDLFFLDSPPGAAGSTPSRLIMVSNRLPITIAKKGDSWTYAMSSGGLVSALTGLKGLPFTWFGWPGLDVAKAEQEGVADDLLAQYSAVPVFIPDKVADMHYNGFSNSILWPLFHYLPGDINYIEEHWEAYKQANTAFADALAAVVKDGDLVWVHDYQLMLLPSLLRAKLADRPNVKIGFFLHIPFPSSEVYRILPRRRELLVGVLQSDLVGFHTYDYARHFLSSCTRILGLSTMPNGVEYEGRRVHVGTFPIGIDPEKFTQGLQSPKVQSRIAVLEERFKGVKILVGVDRLDYIKGVPQKLVAFELFLARHPEWINKVVLVQVGVPSRQDVDEYKHLRSTVNELVGRINGRFGTVEFMPIHFLHKSVNFDELTALYAVSDACVVSSSRDGMNLVSYEYIASQQKKKGVLILSEFAGAAQSLNGSIIVNPWNVEELAESYFEAVTMAEKTRVENHQKLFGYVQKYTAAHWGLTFVRELQRIRKESDAHIAAQLPKNEVVQMFRRSEKKKIILLDYDGTLTDAYNPSEFAQPSAEILNVLRTLASLPQVYVYILSGRSRDLLDEWFKDVDVGLSAEHGCFYKHPKKLGGINFDDFADYDPTPLPQSPPSTLKSIIASDSKDSSRSSTPKMNVTESEALPDLTADSKSGEKPPPPPQPRIPKKADNNWLALVEPVDASWRETVRPLFQHFAERTPGSFIEEKEITLTWYYQNADVEFGAWQAAELQVNVERILSHLAVSIVPGSKSLELRPSLVDKASASRSIIRDIGADNCDFVFCAGDGITDEPVFEHLKSLPNAFTTTVGKKQSAASYYVQGREELQEALNLLATTDSI
ncbi:glycosyltransferase family 20-domain-containing protein [Zopfochytrium polystomum]|nr:glycosyltransferase family 20-domain-containing protein [Zopfochytrium polystomum]